MTRLILLVLVVVVALFGYYTDLLSLGNILGDFANLLIIAAAVDIGLGLVPVTIKVPIAFAKQSIGDSLVDDPAQPIEIGSLKIRRKDINASNLTNAVSDAFFNGGRMPDATRQAIMGYTSPKVWNKKRVPVANSIKSPMQLTTP